MKYSKQEKNNLLIIEDIYFSVLTQFAEDKKIACLQKILFQHFPKAHFLQTQSVLA